MPCFAGSSWFLFRFCNRIWPLRCCICWSKTLGKPSLKKTVKKKRAEAERRKWPRLPLAIPVFVRTRDSEGKELLEFATGLNVSAGGMLVVVRRAPASSAQVLLEIPSAPLATMATLPKVSRNLRAKAVRAQHAEGYYLIGLKFSKTLVAIPNGTRRKAASTL